MARRIIWSKRAQSDKQKILEYWKDRNKSTSYSKKLNRLFNESVKIILDFPGIGKLSNEPNVRIKIVKDYLLLYEEIGNQIHILTIWDSRQDPEKLGL